MLRRSVATHHQYFAVAAASFNNKHSGSCSNKVLAAGGDTAAVAAFTSTNPTYGIARRFCSSNPAPAPDAAAALIRELQQLEKQVDLFTRGVNKLRYSLFAWVLAAATALAGFWYNMLYCVTDEKSSMGQAARDERIGLRTEVAVARTPQSVATIACSSDASATGLMPRGGGPAGA